MPKDIIKVENLYRSYGRLKAVRGLSFSVREGSVHGFLGPNGAGKTTVIKILLGLILPDDGSIEIFGRNLFSARDAIMEKVGAVVESPILFEYFTAFENLHHLSRFSGGASGQRILDTLKIVGLEDVSRQKTGTFSYGMKQRLGIAQALLPENRLIFLDEPTNGLDPHGIAGIRNLIKRLSFEFGITVFLSSHLLSEVEQVCDYVTIIDKGEKVCESSVAELINGIEKIELTTSCPEKFVDFAKQNGMQIFETGINGNRHSFVFSGSEDLIPDLVLKLPKNGIDIFGIEKHTDTLEEIFVALTGKNERDARSDRF